MDGEETAPASSERPPEPEPEPATAEEPSTKQALATRRAPPYVALVLVSGIGIIGWTIGIYLLLHLNPPPVVFTELRIRASVTDASRNTETAEMAPGFNGPIPLPVSDVHCTASGSADTTRVRCEKNGVWTATQVHCEQFEIGFFPRTQTLTISSANASTMVEITVICRNRR